MIYGLILISFLDACGNGVSVPSRTVFSFAKHHLPSMPMQLRLTGSGPVCKLVMHHVLAWMGTQYTTLPTYRLLMMITYDYLPKSTTQHGKV